MALGARAEDVLRIFPGMQRVTIGLGLAGAWLTTLFMATLRYAVSVTDAPTFFANTASMPMSWLAYYLPGVGQPASNPW